MGEQKSNEANGAKAALEVLSQTEIVHGVLPIVGHSYPALLHGASAAHNLPLPIDIAQAPASNSGRPSSVILFRMCTPILTSVF